MTDSTASVLLGATVLGLVVNMLAIFGVVWKGGHFLGHVETVIGKLSTEAGEMRVARERDVQLSNEHARLLERVTVQVENLEARVKRIEDSA